MDETILCIKHEILKKVKHAISESIHWSFFGKIQHYIPQTLQILFIAILHLEIYLEEVIT